MFFIRALLSSYIFTYRRGYCSFNIPTQSKNSAVKGLTQYPMSLSEFAKGYAFAPKLYNMIVSLVPILRGRCGPTTVFRRITSIVIYAVNRVIPGWSWPHIFKEVDESVFPLPSITYSNTAIVVIKLFCFGSLSIAAPNHVTPDVMFRATSHAMSAILFANKLFLFATARNYLTVPKIAVLNCFCVSAVTQA